MSVPYLSRVRFGCIHQVAGAPSRAACLPWAELICFACTRLASPAPHPGCHWAKSATTSDPSQLWATAWLGIRVGGREVSVPVPAPALQSTTAWPGGSFPPGVVSNLAQGPHPTFHCTSEWWKVEKDPPTPHCSGAQPSPSSPKWGGGTGQGGSFSTPSHHSSWQSEKQDRELTLPLLAEAEVRKRPCHKGTPHSLLAGFRIGAGLSPHSRGCSLFPLLPPPAADSPHLVAGVGLRGPFQQPPPWRHAAPPSTWWPWPVQAGTKPPPKAPLTKQHTSVQLEHALT